MRSGVHGTARSRTPRWRTASWTALTIAGRDPIAPASPTPLEPSGVAGDGVHVRSVRNGRQIRGSRDRQLAEAGRHQVAVVVVGHLLVQRLADALGDSSVNLPVDDHRVHDVAYVIDGDEPEHAHEAGLRVDLHQREVGAGREGLRVEVASRTPSRGRVPRRRRPGRSAGPRPRATPSHSAFP